MSTVDAGVAGMRLDAYAGDLVHQRLAASYGPIMVGDIALFGVVLLHVLARVLRM